MKEHEGRKIIGFVERITVFGKDNRAKEIAARIDTGATKGSIDAHLAAELQRGPIHKHRVVKSAHGRMLRPVVKVKVKLADREIESYVTIADRGHMKYKMLIGQDMLTGFLIDPCKK